jgi:hypothetical protein
MDAMVFIPVAQVSQFGAMLLLAGSLFAAILGIVAFAWAMVLLWRENNPQGIVLRGRGRLIVDVDGDEPATEKRSTPKLLTWVNR